MAHVRQQIRDAFAATLRVALPGHTVFSARRYKVNADSLPILDMKFLNENSQYAMQGTALDRTASLYLRVTHEGSEDDIDGTLDDVAVTIEHAIDAEGLFDGLLVDVMLMQTNFTDSGDGDKPLAELVLRYDVLYRTETSDVETAKG